MDGHRLSLDIWRLIFQVTTKQDLRNLCSVSKSFNSIATPLLYRSITLVEPADSFHDISRFHLEKKQPDHLKGHWYLLSRLEDEANHSLRTFVQEVILTCPLDRIIDRDTIFQLQLDNRLPNLIARLPNLRRISIGIVPLQSDNLIRTICDHSRKPELILLQQDGIMADCTFIDQPLPCVSTLHASVNPFDERRGSDEATQNRSMLAIQRLLFHSPNLRSFSLTVYGNYGGCVIVMPRFGVIQTFQLTGEETFPPIKELKLNGYRMNDDEWKHWRDRFNWSKLSSLSIGPQNSYQLLGRMAGYATSLTTLKVSMYANEGYEDREGLEQLLLSFNLLETLELKGYICSVDAIANHGNLSNLLLHEDESAVKEHSRRVLSVQELDHLDIHCPKLKSLKVDIERSNNHLPDYVLQKLATGFKRLRNLSLHFELGLTDIDHPIKPTLNYSSARSIGQAFFDRRKQSVIDFDNTFTLTLWTGACWRRFPQWEPAYSRFEGQYTATYSLRLSSDSAGEIEFRHLQKERWDLMSRQDSKKVSPYILAQLREKAEKAVKGPEDCGQGEKRGLFGTVGRMI